MSHDSVNSRASSLFSVNTAGSQNVSPNSALKARHLKSLHPFFLNVDTSYPFIFTRLRVAIELLQWASMILIPTFFAIESKSNLVWGPVMSAIAIPVHYTVLPLWEGDHFYGRITDYRYFSIISWFAFTVILGIAITMLVKIFLASKEFTRSFGMEIAIHILHFITTVGFQPLFHTFLAFMVCDNSASTISSSGYGRGVLAAFRGGAGTDVDNTSATVGCLASAYPTVMFVFSLVAAMMLVTFKLVLQLFVGDGVPKSQYMYARPSPNYDTWIFSANVTLMVLYHYLLIGTGHRMLFTALFAVASAGIALATAFLMPYFSQRMNQIMCGSFLALSFLSLQQTITLTDTIFSSASKGASQPTLTNTGVSAHHNGGDAILTAQTTTTAFYYIYANWDAIVAILGGVGAFIIGFAWMANLRISADWKRCIALATEGVPPMPLNMPPVFVFPTHLPNHEMHSYRAIEKRMLADERFQRTKAAHVAVQKERAARKGGANTGSPSTGIDQSVHKNTTSTNDANANNTGSGSGGSGKKKAKDFSDSNGWSRKQLETKLAWAGEAHRIHVNKLHSDQAKAEELWIAYPYLPSVIVVGDVEIATRGITRFLEATGLWPPVVMLAFAVRIYTKGLSKYIWSHWLELQFATFLSAFVPSLNPTALTIAEGLVKKDLSYPELFEAHRRIGQIGQSLLIRDNVTKRAFATAQRVHREALQNMKLFWTRLLQDHVDIVRLGALAKVITDRRAEGLKQFLRVQSETSDQQSMLRFAQFLEQVMLDHASAQGCRELLIEGLEQERIAMGGTPTNVGDGSGDVDAPPTSKGEGSLSGVVKKVKKDKDGHEPNNTATANANAFDDEEGSSLQNIRKEKSHTIASLSTNIHLIFLILAAVVLALFAFGFVMDAGRHKTIDRIELGGTARYLSQEAAALVSRLSDPLTVNSEISTIRLTLQRRLVTLRDHLSKLSLGGLRSGDNTIETMYAFPGTALRVSEQHSTNGFLETANALVNSLEQFLRAIDMVTATTGGSAWTVATDGTGGSRTSLKSSDISSSVSTYVAALLRDAGASASDANSGATQSNIASSRNALVASQIRTLANSFMRTNAWLTIAGAFNQSVVAFVEEGQFVLRRTQYISTGLFAVAILVIIAVNFIIVFNLRKISANKTSTLGLFTLIPRNALERLRDEATERLDRFDEPDPAFQRMKAERGLEDEDDVRRRMLEDDPQLLMGSDGGTDVTGSAGMGQDPGGSLHMQGGFMSSSLNRVGPTTASLPYSHHHHHPHDDSDSDSDEGIFQPQNRRQDGNTHNHERSSSGPHSPMNPTSTGTHNSPADDDTGEDIGVNKLYARLVSRGDLALADTGGHHAGGDALSSSGQFNGPLTATKDIGPMSVSAFRSKSSLERSGSLSRMQKGRGNGPTNNLIIKGGHKEVSNPLSSPITGLNAVRTKGGWSSTSNGRSKLIRSYFTLGSGTASSSSGPRGFRNGSGSGSGALGSSSGTNNPNDHSAEYGSSGDHTYAYNEEAIVDADLRAIEDSLTRTHQSTSDRKNSAASEYSRKASSGSSNEYAAYNFSPEDFDENEILMEIQEQAGRVDVTANILLKAKSFAAKNRHKHGYTEDIMRNKGMRAGDAEQSHHIFDANAMIFNFVSQAACDYMIAIFTLIALCLSATILVLFSLALAGTEANMNDILSSESALEEVVQLIDERRKLHRLTERFVLRIGEEDLKDLNTAQNARTYDLVSAQLRLDIFKLKEGALMISLLDTHEDLWSRVNTVQNAARVLACSTNTALDCQHLPLATWQRSLFIDVYAVDERAKGISTFIKQVPPVVATNATIITPPSVITVDNYGDWLPVNETFDMAQTRAWRIATARAPLANPTYYKWYRASLQPLFQLLTEVSAQGTSALVDGSARMSAIVQSGIGVSAGLAAILLIAYFLLRFSAGQFTNTRHALTITIAMSLIAIILASYVLSVFPTIDREGTVTVNIMALWNESITANDDLLAEARRAAFFNDPVALGSFATRMADRRFDFLWGEFAAAMSDDTLSSVQTCVTDSRNSFYIEAIAVTIATNFFNLTKVPPILQAFNWNVSSDVNAVRFVLQNPTQKMFSDRPTDFARNNTDKRQLIRELILGPIRRSSFERSSVNCKAAVMQTRAEKSDALKRSQDTVFAILVTLICIGVAGVILTLIFLADILKYRYESLSAGLKTRDERVVGGDDELFSALMRQSRLALCLLVFVFTALFLFNILEIEAAIPDVDNQNLASMREFEIYRSLALSAKNNENRTAFRTMAEDAGLKSMTSGTAFYRGAATTLAGRSKANVGRNDDIDDALFGPILSVPASFECTDSSTGDGDGSSSSSVSSVAALTTLPYWTSTVPTLLNRGVDMAQRRWRDEVMALANYRHTSAAVQILRGLQTAADSLGPAVHETTLQFSRQARRNATTGLAGYMGILAFIAVVLLYQFFLVFRPIIDQLTNEEEGTKVMLKMIPSDVRERVPAIAEYLETGIVIQDVKVHEVNEAATDLSTVPTISIDFDGTILTFSKAAEHCFYWTKEEVVGKNIKLLMPEDIATEHDGYLATYRRTGVKRIIGNVLKTRAMRRNGTTFPAELSVKEVHRGRSTIFIGTVRDIEKEMEFEKAMAISTAVSEAAAIPIIVIDKKGVILRFNQAARHTFRTEAPMEGRKINELMPIEMAEQHDGFMAKYLLHRVKNVIDASRVMQALRANGEVFPARITVKEHKAVHGGAAVGANKDIQFIGYVEDLTRQVGLRLAAMVGDSIPHTSPIPYIETDRNGLITAFSPAAEQLFGFSIWEVRGKNISLLMPPDTADKHDGYVKTYHETRRKKTVDATTLQYAQKRTNDGKQLVVFPIRISLKELNEAGSAPGDGNAVAEQQAENIAAGLLNPSSQPLSALAPIVSAVAPDTGTSNQPSARFVAFIEDVSEERQLEKENIISAKLIAMSPIPIIVTDIAGTIVSFSPSAEKAFGFTASEAIGADAVTLLSPTDVAFSPERYVQMDPRAGNRYLLDSAKRVLVLPKDGRTFSTELTIKPVVNLNGVSPFYFNASGGQSQAAFPGTATAFVANQQQQTQQVRLVALFRSAFSDQTDSPVADTAIYTDYISRLATTPLVWIDARGTILGCSESTIDRFQWARDELIGQNVSVLMPESIASRHDEYLWNYRQRLGAKGREDAARSSPVIGKERRVMAKTRDEQVFTASLLVKDIHIGSLEPVFVGYIRDLTSEMELATQKHLSTAIIQTSFIPIICIDQNGSVQEFSSAAEAVFGYSRAELLGENVKILMPDHVAKSHDGYLKAYAKTRIKSIIDSKRPVTALRRDKTEFQAELMVKEIVHKDAFGKDTTEYIGYVKDLSYQTILDQATRINELVASLSAVPILIINPRGMIIECNAATENDFGYAPGELVGKNVKMLMPEDVAVEHDSYLSRYRATHVKKVIDNTRVVRGIRKDRTIFSAELSVREVKKSDGTEGQFIGYLRDVTVEQQIAATNYINTTMMDLSPIPVLVIDHKGTVQHFSRAASKAFEYPVSSVIGQNVKMLMPDDIAAEHDGYLERYLITHVPHVIGSTRRVYGKKSTGKIFPVELNIREVFDEQLNVPVYVGFVQDLTEEAEIEAMNAFSEMVNILSPVPVISITHDGTVVRFSASAEQEFKVQASEIIGKNVKLLQPPEVADQHDMYLRRYQETKVKHVIDNTRQTVAKRWDGSTFRVSLFIKEVKDNDHEYPLFVGYIKNIEEDNRIEEASKENAAMQLLAPLPVFVITKNGIVLDVNPAVEAVFGYSQNEVKGHNINMIMPQHIASQHDEYLRRYLRTGEKHVIDQIRATQGKRKDGTVIPIEISIREVQVPGMETQYVGYVKDTSMNQRMVESLRWNEAIISLAATPLVVIDPEGLIMKFTLEAEKLFQYNADEVIGKNVKMLMPPEIARKHDRYIERYHVSRIKTVIDHNRRVKGKKKNGEVFLCELGVREILNEDDSMTEAFAGYIRPIHTDHNSLIEGSSEINSMMHAVSLHGVIIIDEVGIIEKANPSVAEMFGVQEAMLIGKNVKMLMPYDIAKNHDDYLSNYLKTGIKRVIDTKRVTYGKNVATQNVFPMELSVKELTDTSVTLAEGETRAPRRYLGCIRFIEHEIQIERQRMLNKHTLDLSMSGTIVSTHKGSIIMFSLVAEKLFGCSSEQVVGKVSISNLLPQLAQQLVDGTDFLSAYRRAVSSASNQQHLLHNMPKTTPSAPTFVSVAGNDQQLTGSGSQHLQVHSSSSSGANNTQPTSSYVSRTVVAKRFDTGVEFNVNIFIRELQFKTVPGVEPHFVTYVDPVVEE